MKHIAIIYEQELDIGGVETHLLSLFRRVDPVQYRFSIFAPTSNPYRQEAARLGVQVFPLAPYKPLSWRAFQHIHRLLHEEHVDLVHAHSPTAAVPARLAARTLGLPAVVTVHIPAKDYHGVRHTLRANSGRKLYVFLDRVLNHSLTERLIYVSAQVYAQEIEGGAAPTQRALVIPNGVDLSKFQSATSQVSLEPASPQAVEYEPGELDNSPTSNLRQEIWRDYHLPPGLPVIIYIGRLTDQKGLDVLLDSLAQINNQKPDSFNAWLVGAGPLEAELKSRAAAAGLSERIGFLGPHPETPAYLAAADIFVLPSRWEAMSFSLIEAAASGLPCVVSDTGDNARVIEDGKEGLVVSPGSGSALTAALSRLLADADLRLKMGENARRKSLQYSDLEMAHQVQVVYDQALR